MLRPAISADIQRLVEMGQALHSESTYAHVKYSPGRVEATCQHYIENGFVIVSEKAEQVVGVMIGDVQVPWYTDEPLGYDLTLYIEPAHRQGIMAMRMIKRFEEWAISKGATQLRPGIGTGNESIIRLYKAMGYKHVGELLLKNL